MGGGSRVRVSRSFRAPPTATPAWQDGGMTPAAFRKLALSMPGAHEEPHFQRTSFRVGKKIFATMSPDGLEAMVPVHPLARCAELLASDAVVFIDYGGWTKRLGSLGMRLAKVDAKLIAVLVYDAWARIAPKGGRSARSARGTP